MGANGPRPQYPLSRGAAARAGRAARSADRHAARRASAAHLASAARPAGRRNDVPGRGRLPLGRVAQRGGLGREHLADVSDRPTRQPLRRYAGTHGPWRAIRRLSEVWYGESWISPDRPTTCPSAPRCETFAHPCAARKLPVRPSPHCRGRPQGRPQQGIALAPVCTAGRLPRRYPRRGSPLRRRVSPAHQALRLLVRQEPAEEAPAARCGHPWVQHRQGPAGAAGVPASHAHGSAGAGWSLGFFDSLPAPR